MAIKINFDVNNNPESPTLVLAKKNGDKIGKINACEIEVVGSLNDASEISFTVYKYVDGVKDYLWDEIVNFRLAYCVEWDKFFEISVELDESSETKKTVSGTCLGHAELSQIMLYNIQINTEDDIARDAYDADYPTILYRENDHHEASLLHRIMEKAPHYRIIHVDSTIAKIQRTFEFDGTSIYDAFQDIAEEIGCLFVLHSNSDKDGNVQRTISVYDLESNCLDCGHRSEFTMVCPKCGSKNIDEGYGDDTGIFITSDELAESIQLSTDTDQVKNCFKLEAGDDLMTATIRNCNPNGSDYIWYITDATKKDMSEELVDKIAKYDEEYASYYNNVDYYPKLNSSAVSAYNSLVNNYKEHDSNLSEIPASIVGYRNLMKIYYDTVDFSLYLKSSLMPTTKLADTNAETEAAKLTATNLNPVAATSLTGLSSATAESLVLAMAKAVIDNRFQVKVKSSSLSGTTWTGNFTVTNYSNEDDTAESASISISITDDYKTYVKQKIDKTLAKGDDEDVSITGLFKKELASFTSVIKNYSLSRLTSFHDACQSAIDILVEQGIADKETWSTNTDGDNLYDDLYTPYLNKLKALETEMNLRQQEVETIVGAYDKDGNLTKSGLQNYIEGVISDVQDALDFEKYLGEDLWFEMCSFRREDKYSNDNYISDGFTNAEIIEKANEFIEEANKEIYKSAELQHSISADLNNLLVIDKFKPLVNDFKVGNWIRVMVDDELFKLRLVEYTIDYDDIESLPVEFSDTVSVNSTMKSIQGVIDQASSMATSYESIKKQAEQGKSGNDQLSEWVNKGLSLTNMKIVGSAENQNVTWDSHGILCREYLPITDTYDDRQLKIINRGLYVTNDNWETAKAGIGNFIFYNPETKQNEEGYGVIADTLVGNLILSKKVGIYNEENSITLDDKGLTITVDDDSAKTKTAFTIQKKLSDNSIKNLMYVDSNGNLALDGSLTVKSSSGDTTLSGLGQTASNYLTYENGVLKVGATGSGYTSISDSGVSVHNSAGTQLGSFNGSAVTIGQTNNYNAYITNSGVNLRYGTTILNSITSSGMNIYSNGTVVGSFGSSSITLGGSNTTSITMAGTATLNVAALNIGGTGAITSKEDLRGPKGEDISSQYLDYRTSGSYAGLNVVTDSGVTGLHANIANSSFSIMNNTNSLATINSGGLVLANGMGFAETGVDGVFFVSTTVSVSYTFKQGEQYVKISLTAQNMRDNARGNGVALSDYWRPMSIVALYTSNYKIAKIAGFNLNPSATGSSTGLTINLTRNGSSNTDKVTGTLKYQILWIKGSYASVSSDTNDDDIGTGGDTGGGTSGSDSGMPALYGYVDGTTLYIYD